MRELWSENRKFEIWLEIETLACEAMAELGQIPKADAAEIRKQARFSISEIAEIEKRTNHDVIAFLENVAASVGPAARWMHQGLTSSDVLDTTLAVQLTEASKILADDLATLRDVVAKKARQFKLTPMIGRSHGIHAEPITFGLKMALMFDEFGRAEERLAQTTERIRVGKLSGAVGTHAHLDPAIERSRLREAWLEARDAFNADHPTRSARRVLHDPRDHRFEHRPLGDRVSSSSTDRSPRSGGIFQRRPERAVRRCRTSATRSPASGFPGSPA